MKRPKPPTASHRKALKYRGEKCLNCGQPLDKSDMYCPYCSQLNSTKHLSARDFLAEFLSSILVYDSRLRTTLKDLLFHPGRLTKNYVAGQRLKYANPFRFFLSVSIIYFLLQSLVGIISPTGAETPSIKLIPPNEPVADSITPAKIPEIFFSNVRGDTLTAKKLGIPMYFSEKALDSLSFFDNYHKRSSLYLAYHYTHQTEKPKEALNHLHHTDNFTNRWLYSRTIAWQKIMEHPDEFVNYTTTNIPFFLFFFTPFYALFFWLLYSKKKYTYMEHMIFIFHIFSFVFLVLLIAILPDELFGNDIVVSALFTFIGPFYFYNALRKFYGQGHLVTLIKFVILSILFSICFFVAMVFFVAASVVIY